MIIASSRAGPDSPNRPCRRVRAAAPPGPARQAWRGRAQETGTGPGEWRWAAGPGMALDILLMANARSPHSDLAPPLAHTRRPPSPKLTHSQPGTTSPHHGPASAWRPRAPRAHDQKPKPGDWDSYPPDLYMGLGQDGYFRSQYNGLLTPDLIEAFTGLITRGRQKRVQVEA